MPLSAGVLFAVFLELSGRPLLFCWSLLPGCGLHPDTPFPPPARFVLCFFFGLRFSSTSGVFPFSFAGFSRFAPLALSPSLLCLVALYLTSWVLPVSSAVFFRLFFLLPDLPPPQPCCRPFRACPALMLFSGGLTCRFIAFFPLCLFPFCSGSFRFPLPL